MTHNQADTKLNDVVKVGAVNALRLIQIAGYLESKTRGSFSRPKLISMGLALLVKELNIPELGANV